jgi:hypothetical protein
MIGDFRIVKMLWGGRRGCGTFDAVQEMSDGALHVGTFQPEQVPHRP